MTSLKYHMRLRCKGEKFNCDICDKSFNNYPVMIVHHRSHLGERPFKCVDCRKPHRWASDLKTHYKLHQQENLYAYENHKFADDLPSIQKHVVKKHAGEKGYKQNLHQQSYSG